MPTQLEYQGQISTIEKALAVPGIDLAERNIYLSTIEKIRQKMAEHHTTPEATNIAAPPQSAPQHYRPLPPPQPTKTKQQATKITLNQLPAPTLKTAQAFPTQTQAQHTSVTIHWPGGDRTYRYHEVRSRLYISLKTLIESTAHNKASTYKSIENYAAWSNAATYYNAVSAIWGYPPTFHELDFSSATISREQLEEMFNKIITHNIP